jgi:hypothetical protein
MWSLSSFWNEIAVKPQQSPQKRDYVYASEIGYPIIDRYLKMCGVDYTNPPNDRSLRKFWTGNFFEEAVERVLITAGIFKQREIKVDSAPYSDTLDVHGRLDFIAGGYIDPDNVAFQAARNKLPEFLQPITDKFINELAGKTIPEVILEIKSVSLYAYEYVEKKRKPMDAHAAQAYHYKRGLGLPAVVCYISKDTSMMCEFEVQDTVEAAYRADLEKITHYFQKRETPPLEPLLFFDPALAKFSKNLGVEYSSYLTMLYGYKNPDEYRRNIEPSVKRWNNGLQRWAAAEKGLTTPTGRPITLTPANKEALKEIHGSGFDLKDLLQQKLEMMDSETIDDLD